MIIGVDIDDVVADLINDLNAFMKAHHNRDFSRDMYKSFYFNDVWKMPQDEFEKTVREWRDSPYFSDMGVIEHSQATLESLSKEHEIIFITSRNVDKENVTRKWLEKNFKFPIKVCHTFNKYAKESTAKGKLETCKDLGVTLMVEDQTAFSLECANGGVQVILFDTPWNQDFTHHERITKVKTWTEAKKIIDKLSAAKKS